MVGVMYGLFHLHRLDLWRLYPFEALAEIFDFVAGLVQRVPKKTNEMKSDLQNSTAILPRKKDLKKKEYVLVMCRIFNILLFCLK